MNNDNIACPQCGSDDVSKPRLTQRAFALTLFLGFPLPFLEKKYHCFNCGLDFKKSREENPDVSAPGEG